MLLGLSSTSRRLCKALCVCLRLTVLVAKWSLPASRRGGGDDFFQMICIYVNVGKEEKLKVPRPLEDTLQRIEDEEPFIQSKSEPRQRQQQQQHKLSVAHISFFSSLVLLIRTRTDWTVVFGFLLLCLPSLFGGPFCSLLFLSTHFGTIRYETRQKLLSFGFNSQLLLDLAATAVEVEGAAVVLIVSISGDLYHSACLFLSRRNQESRSGREHLAKGTIPSPLPSPYTRQKPPPNFPSSHHTHTHTLSLFT